LLTNHTVSATSETLHVALHKLDYYTYHYYY